MAGRSEGSFGNRTMESKGGEQTGNEIKRSAPGSSFGRSPMPSGRRRRCSGKPPARIGQLVPAPARRERQPTRPDRPARSRPRLL